MGGSRDKKTDLSACSDGDDPTIGHCLVGVVIETRRCGLGDAFGVGCQKSWRCRRNSDKVDIDGFGGRGDTTFSRDLDACC